MHNACLNILHVIKMILLKVNIYQTSCVLKVVLITKTIRNEMQFNQFLLMMSKLIIH